MSTPADQNVAVAVASNATCDIDSLIRKCSQIATLPSVVVEIIRLTEDPNSTIDDLNKVIVNDPALGVRILKLANSSYYGASGQIDSISRALMMLGANAVKNIAVAASLVKLWRGGRVCPGFEAKDLWTHSIAVAAGARLLAKKSNQVSADEAFLAGLIHDIGIVVEMQACGPMFAQLIERLDADDALTFRSAEEATFGASHEAIGAALCKNWSFSPRLQLATAYHHRPWELAQTHRPLPTLIHIADVLAAQNGLGCRRTVETDRIEPELLSFVKLCEASLDEVTKDLPAMVQESLSLLSDAN